MSKWEIFCITVIGIIFQTAVFVAIHSSSKNIPLERRQNLLQNKNEMQQAKATKNMRLGYARVSKMDDQSTKAQMSALKEAGCEKIFEETASGGRWDRPELHRLLDQLRPGDTLVVWKLDRLSRSLKDLLNILEKVERANAGFQSLTEAIDTVTPSGRALMQMIGVFAEFERAMIRERTKAGLEEARKEGRVGGRRPKTTPAQKQEIIDAVTSGRKTEAQMARLFGLHRSTIHRIMQQNKLQP